jgi:hypothetical protein
MTPISFGASIGQNALTPRHKFDPLVQRNMRAIKTRDSAHQEVPLALITTIKAILLRRDPFAAFFAACVSR